MPEDKPKGNEKITSGRKRISKKAISKYTKRLYGITTSTKVLVIIDHLTHCVEACLTMTATAETVSKILLEQIVPRYGIINTSILTEVPLLQLKYYNN